MAQRQPTSTIDGAELDADALARRSLRGDLFGPDGDRKQGSMMQQQQLIGLKFPRILTELEANEHYI